jgi:hypothetical protein
MVLFHPYKLLALCAMMYIIKHLSRKGEKHSMKQAQSWKIFGEVIALTQCLYISFGFLFFSLIWWMAAQLTIISNQQTLTVQEMLSLQAIGMLPPLLAAGLSFPILRPVARRLISVSKAIVSAAPLLLHLRLDLPRARWKLPAWKDISLTSLLKHVSTEQYIWMQALLVLVCQFTHFVPDMPLILRSALIMFSSLYVFLLLWKLSSVKTHHAISAVLPRLEECPAQAIPEDATNDG